MVEYYTPELSEFHVGFEYEITTGYEWVSESFTHKDFNTFLYQHLDNAIKQDYVRVKYLDKEDVESLGFEEEHVPNCYTEDGDIQLGYALYLDEVTCVILHHTLETSIVGIVKQHVYNRNSGNWTANKLFLGTIKNKSELIKLLQQIGIRVKDNKE